MPLTTLPLEVLEILLLYFGLNDLINVMDVLGFQGSSFFWKEVCRRQGFKGEEQCWKTVFLRNINWLKKNFIKREYDFPESKESVLSSSSVLNCSISMRGAVHGSNILLKSKNDEIFVWDIERFPKFVQSFYAEHLAIGGSKLVTQSSTEICIYEKQELFYQKVFTSSDILLNHFSNISLTNDFFVAFMDDFLSIKVINLKNLDDFIVRVSNTKVSPISKLVVSENALFILLNVAGNYVLKQFDLKTRMWRSEIVLFHGAALISFPELKLSSKLIASWSYLLEYRGVTPLKIWDTNGELLQSLSMEFIRSFGTHTCSDETILWIILEGEYIILSICGTSMSIWTARNPDVLKELKMESFSNKQTIVSSSVLILSYCNCFKVIDFKKCVYLYEVRFDNYTKFDVELLHLSEVSFVNDYFYIRLSKKNDMGREKKPKEKEISVSNGNLEINQEDSYSLIIYDYSGRIRAC